MEFDFIRSVEVAKTGHVSSPLTLRPDRGHRFVLDRVISLLSCCNHITGGCYSTVTLSLCAGHVFFNSFHCSGDSVPYCRISLPANVTHMSWNTDRWCLRNRRIYGRSNMFSGLPSDRPSVDIYSAWVTRYLCTQWKQFDETWHTYYSRELILLVCCCPHLQTCRHNEADENNIYYLARSANVTQAVCEVHLAATQIGREKCHGEIVQRKEKTFSGIVCGCPWVMWNDIVKCLGELCRWGMYGRNVSKN